RRGDSQERQLPVDAGPDQVAGLLVASLVVEGAPNAEQQALDPRRPIFYREVVLPLGAQARPLGGVAGSRTPRVIRVRGKAGNDRVEIVRDAGEHRLLVGVVEELLTEEEIARIE